jgi:hypothetical protein
MATSVWKGHTAGDVSGHQGHSAQSQQAGHDGFATGRGVEVATSGHGEALPAIQESYWVPASEAGASG